MAQEWTDGRLDDLNVKVDRGFEQVDQRFDRVDQRFDQVDQRFDQVDNRFDQVDQRFEQVDHRFDRVEREIVNLRVETRTEFSQLRGEMKEGFARIDERSDSLHHVLVMGFIAMTGSMLAGFSAILVLIATQL